MDSVDDDDAKLCFRFAGGTARLSYPQDRNQRVRYEVALHEPRIKQGTLDDNGHSMLEI
jgi:hypothetical protein